MTNRRNNRKYIICSIIAVLCFMTGCSSSKQESSKSSSTSVSSPEAETVTEEITSWETEYGIAGRLPEDTALGLTTRQDCYIYLDEDRICITDKYRRSGKLNTYSAGYTFEDGVYTMDPQPDGDYMQIIYLPAEREGGYANMEILCWEVQSGSEDSSEIEYKCDSYGGSLIPSSLEEISGQPVYESDVWPVPAEVSQNADDHFDYNLGSAKDLSGDVVVVSVFADCPSFCWDYNSEEDLALQDEMLKQLGIATDWISEQAADYGQEVNFIYDWTGDSALKTTDSFSLDISTKDNDSMYYMMKHTHISAGERNVWSPLEELTIELLDKYETDEVLYLFFLNGTETNENQCFALTRDLSSAIEPFEGALHEMAAIYCSWEYGKRSGTQNAIVMAHEILHLFGAVDVYQASKAIPQSYVDEVKKKGIKDIMGTIDVSQRNPDYVDAVLSEIDAYYVGLLPTSELRLQWKSIMSSHESGHHIKP